MVGAGAGSKAGAITERPTRARYGVISFAITLAVLSYVDRVCISQAAPDIVRDLHFSDVDMGKIFGAFGLAYAFFEIPTGWLGDWIGPRKVLMRIVLWWSVFTAAHGRHAKFHYHVDYALPVRRRRSRLLPEPDQGLHHLAPPGGARQGAGHHVDLCALGRRLHSPGGGHGVAICKLALCLRDVRGARHRLGVFLLSPGIATIRASTRA